MNQLSRLCEQYTPTGTKPRVPCQKQDVSDADRHNRPNAMMHYPFADNCGSVDRVLSNSNGKCSHPILRMSSPARKRWSHQVFDDMCIGRTRMRIADVPEALKSLELTVSPDLAKALRKHCINKSTGVVNKIEIPIEATVDANQWYAIVKRCIRREQILIMTGSDAEINASAAVDKIADGFDDDIETSSSVSYPSILDGIANIPNADSTSIQDFEGGLSNEQISAKQEKRERQYQQRLQIRNDRQRFNMHKDRRDKAAMASVGGRRVSSLLASSSIGRDNGSRRHQSSSSTADTSKVNAWREPMFASSKHREEYGDNSTSFAANLVKSQAITRRNKLSLGRWADLNTGTAALEIADSFLSGPVGRELSHPSSFMANGDGNHAERRLIDMQGDEFDRDIVNVVTALERKHLQKTKAAAASEADYLLHGNTRFLPSDRGVDNWETSASHLGARGAAAYAFSAGSSTTKDLGLGHKTVREREAGQARAQASRSLYSQGWRSSRGGWVADFGPPHTHILNRDEDLDDVQSIAQLKNNYYRKVHANKQFHGMNASFDRPDVEGVDDFTMSVSNTLHRADAGVPETGIHVPYSQNRLPSERIASLKQEFGLSSKKSSTRHESAKKRVDDDGDGDSSLDEVGIHEQSKPYKQSAVGVDNDDESLAENTRLLSSIQESMSLSAAAGKTMPHTT